MAAESEGGNVGVRWGKWARDLAQTLQSSGGPSCLALWAKGKVKGLAEELVKSWRIWSRGMADFECILKIPLSVGRK